MSNAATGTVTSNANAVDLFKSARVGGSDADGVLAVTVYNRSAYDALIRANIHGASEWGPLPAGKSVTLRYHPVAGSTYGQIDLVQIKRAGSDNVTIDHLVTEWR